MTSRTRCPHCSASLPLDAAWCSLCHADLRPEPEPLARFQAQPVASNAPSGSGDTVTEPAPLPPVRGRHRREPAQSVPVGALATATRSTAPTEPTEPTEPTASTGSTGSTESTARVVPVAPEDVPLTADGRPDVEAAAARMLAQLAATDAGSGIPDVQRVPGGAWGLLLGGMALVVVICLVAASAAAVFLG